MRYFLDTEFYENGPDKPTQLISIALVPEDESKPMFYAENLEFNWGLVPKDHWLQDNVRPYLTGVAEARSVIKERIISYIGDTAPEFWAYFADYDWVVFCQIFGSMLTLPEGFPMYCLDLRQLMYHSHVSKHHLPPMPVKDHTHNALDDATWNRAAFKVLAKIWAEDHPKQIR